MRIVVGVTDSRWAAFLRDHPTISEANFWQPSPHSFKALAEGEPFLFKTKHPRTFPGLDMPDYALVGGGFFEQYSRDDGQRGLGHLGAGERSEQ